jgi:hypothetical protein
MKPTLLIIPVLIATALFAQGPGAFGGRRGQGSGTPGATPTPPTPEQAATREVNLISAALRLTTAQTTALLADLACASCALTTQQTALQANAATLKTDWTALAAELTSAPPGSTTTTVSAINGLELSNLEARVAAAGAVLAELATQKVTLTSAQQTTVVNLVVRGGGGFRR